MTAREDLNRAVAVLEQRLRRLRARGDHAIADRVASDERFRLKGLMLAVQREDSRRATTKRPKKARRARKLARRVQR